MKRRIMIGWLALIFVAASASSCASQSTSTGDFVKPLQLALNDYLEKDMQLRHLKVLDTKLSLSSQQSDGQEVAAVFSVDITHRLDYTRAEDAPALKGPLNFMRDYEKKLSPQQLKRANEDIEKWRRDLNEYITTDQYMFNRIKVVGKLDSTGKLLPGSVKFYREGDGPNGKGIVYVPMDLKEIPTPQEVERDSYNAIRDTVGIANN